MNDVREAVERIGDRVDPPMGGIADLLRRRDRIGARRRVAARGLALMIAGGGSLLAGRAFLASAPEPDPNVRVAAIWPATRAGVAATDTNCPAPSGDGPSAVVLSSTSGPAGSTVEVSGAFPEGTVFLQLWWNADRDRLPGTLDPPPWPPSGPHIRFRPAASGPVVQLAAEAGPGSSDDCSFRTRFTVPDVETGTYVMLWTFGAANSSQGYALLTSEVMFEVTEQA